MKYRGSRERAVEEDTEAARNAEEAVEESEEGSCSCSPPAWGAASAAARYRSSCAVVVVDRRCMEEPGAGQSEAADEGPAAAGLQTARLLSNVAVEGGRGSRRGVLSSRYLGLAEGKGCKTDAQVRARPGVDSVPASACTEAPAHGVVARRDVAGPGEEGDEARLSEEDMAVAAAVDGMAGQEAAVPSDEAGEPGEASEVGKADAEEVDDCAVRQSVTTGGWRSRDGGACCQAAPDPCLIYMYIRTMLYEKTRDEAKKGSSQVQGGEGGGHGKALGNEG